YGLGQVVYMGTDNTWRWREGSGGVLHPLIWSQIIQHLALQHLLGGSKRTQLSADKERYIAGERVTVFARLYDANFAPLHEPSVRGSYASTSNAAMKGDVLLRAVPDQLGMYRGDFVVSAPGG